MSNTFFYIHKLKAFSTMKYMWCQKSFVL